MMTETAYQTYADTGQHQDWIDVSCGQDDCPWYISFARGIRDRLATQTDRSLSQCPDDIATVEELFTKSKHIAKQQWASAMLESICVRSREESNPY